MQAVIDYQNWMYDLSFANKNIHVRPIWYKSYSFKKEYNLIDLSAKSLSDWLSIAAKNETLLNKYYRYDMLNIKLYIFYIIYLYYYYYRNFYKQAEPSLQENCDLNCKKQYLCNIIVGSETKLCNILIN